MAETALAPVAGARAAPGARVPDAAPPRLDELMLAMDVVDTLRHQETLVYLELDESKREAELIERLRELYRGQGIAVPDRVLKEGVQALKESRFLYTPPAPGLGTTLARLWVARKTFGLALAGLLVALALGWLAYEFAVVRPAEQRAEQARVDAERTRLEFTERLPKALAAGHAEVTAEARDPKGRERADRILADGRAATARQDGAGARKALADLEALRAELRREYWLRIVSRPGEPTGVFRVPDRNRQARNYYLVVEAIGPDGRLVTLPVASEEDGKTTTVSKWGARVSREVFDAIRRDKDDDGIVQKNRLGEKRRGYLDLDYAFPVLGGAITQW